MTNSQATVLRPRRLNPRVFLLAGMTIVAVSIPVAFMTRNFDWHGLLGSFNPAGPAQEKTQNPSGMLPAKPVQTQDDAAGYLKVLDQASKSLSGQIAKNPTDPTLQNRLGLLYLNLGDLQSAEQCFTSAVTLSRSALSACSARIDSNRAAGKMSAAANDVLKASAISVELSAAHSNLARVYDQMGDRTRVISELELLNKDGLLFKGAALGGTGKLKVSDGRLTPLEAKMLADAEALFKGNNAPAAAAEYKKLISMNSKLSLPHERLGLIAVMAGDTAGAIDEFEAAAKIEPGSAVIQNNLGMAFSQMGMVTEAQRAFRRAVALDPSLSEAAVNLGNLLSTSGKTGEATAVLRQAADASPKSARAQNNLATFLTLNGNDQEAIGRYNRAIKLDPNMASAYYGMGLSLMHTKQYLPAIRSFKKAQNIDPRLSEAQTKIEECYRQAGHRG